MAGILNRVLPIAGCVVAAGAFSTYAAQSEDSETAAQTAAQTTSPTADAAYVLGHTVERIDGTKQDLSEYKGKVLLIVNVASRCGYTPQYDGLQKLYASKKEAGLVVMGFPANNFGAQEPGTNQEIAEFCSSKFGVDFPLFAKVSVKGSDQHPLFKQLASQPEPIGGDPKWNFTKFLVDRSGKVVGRFDSKVRPDDAELVKKIDELLKASS